MGLAETFQKGAKTAFLAFGNVIKDAVYTQIVDDGFDKVETEHDCTVAPVSDMKEIQDMVNFKEPLQPNDIIALVPGIDLTVAMDTNGTLTFPDVLDVSQTYYIMDTNIDPAKALWILLLRK